MLNEKQIRLIKAAEVEFAERGFDGASVRGITQRAEMNIAAINYHFGSKSDLFFEMIRHRVEPINALRLEMMDKAYQRNGGKALEIEEIVDIMIRPFYEQIVANRKETSHFVRAMGRCLMEEQSFMIEVQEKILAPVIQRFRNSIKHSLENVDPLKVFFSIHLTSCMFAGAMSHHKRLEKSAFDSIDETTQQKEFVEYLVRFISGGIKAITS